VFVRSLRRRLWKALQEEDAETALRAYTASKDEYLVWLEEERLERERRVLAEEEERHEKKKVRFLGRWDLSRPRP
jgi:hypothetical protein